MPPERVPTLGLLPAGHRQDLKSLRLRIAIWASKFIPRREMTDGFMALAVTDTLGVTEMNGGDQHADTQPPLPGSGTKNQPNEEVLGWISLWTSGQNLWSGPPNPEKKTSILAQTSCADVHEIWKTSGWFLKFYSLQDKTYRERPSWKDNTTSQLHPRTHKILHTDCFLGGHFGNVLFFLVGEVPGRGGWRSVFYWKS